MNPQEPPFVWAIAANITDAPDRNGLPGTRHFAPHQLVYLDLRYDFTHHRDDMAVGIFGRHRGTRRWIRIIVPLQRLTHLRLKRVYAPPSVVRMLQEDAWTDAEQQRRVCEAELATLAEKMALVAQGVR